MMRSQLQPRRSRVPPRHVVNCLYQETIPILLRIYRMCQRKFLTYWMTNFMRKLPIQWMEGMWFLIEICKFPSLVSCILTLSVQTIRKIAQVIPLPSTIIFKKSKSVPSPWNTLNLWLPYVYSNGDLHG